MHCVFVFSLCYARRAWESKTTPYETVLTDARPDSFLAPAPCETVLTDIRVTSSKLYSTLIYSTHILVYACSFDGCADSPLFPSFRLYCKPSTFSLSPLCVNHPSSLQLTRLESKFFLQSHPSFSLRV